MYQIRPTSRFSRDVKLLARRGYNMDLLTRVIHLLASGAPLPSQYRDHPLSGDYTGTRECHISPDWLLVYEIEKDTLFLYLIRTGTHSDLF